MTSPALARWLAFTGLDPRRGRHFLPVLVLASLSQLLFVNANRPEDMRITSRMLQSSSINRSSAAQASESLLERSAGARRSANKSARSEDVLPSEGSEGSIDSERVSEESAEQYESPQRTELQGKFPMLKDEKKFNDFAGASSGELSNMSFDGGGSLPGGGGNFYDGVRTKGESLSKLVQQLHGEISEGLTNEATKAVYKSEEYQHTTGEMARALGTYDQRVSGFHRDASRHHGHKTKKLQTLVAHADPNVLGGGHYN